MTKAAGTGAWAATPTASGTVGSAALECIITPALSALATEMTRSGNIGDYTAEHKKPFHVFHMSMYFACSIHWFPL